MEAENAEARDAGVLEEPSAVKPADVVEAWNPAELAAAQAIDLELAVVYGWRLESEDPSPWRDVLEHSATTKELLLLLLLLLLCMPSYIAP